MLAYGEYSSVTYDLTQCTLSFNSMNGSGETETIEFSNLDANGTAWFVWPHRKDGVKEVGLKVYSLNGENGIKWYNNKTNSRGDNRITNIVFDLSKTFETPDFMGRISKCVKRLIELCGGTKEYDPLLMHTPKRDELTEKASLLNFLRAKIMVLAPDSFFFNYMIDAAYNEYNCTLAFACHSRSDMNSLRIIDFSQLDANSLVWEIYQPPKYYKRSLRLTLIGKNGSGTIKEYRYNGHDLSPRDYTASFNGEIEPASPPSFLFDVSKAADIPNFQEEVSKAVKRLIELCGGKKEGKDPFAN
jgi:hypothetical protein